MIRWMLTLLAVHGATDRSDRRVPALVGGDGSCAVCDHPFAHLSHACIA
jgi:hypothetical protein